MQSLICQLMMVSVLFMNAEGALDMASDGHPHSDDRSHQVDINSEPGTDQSGNHCEHCCHGHVAFIGIQLASMTLLNASDHQGSDVSQALNHAQAPPTPPPNA